MIKIRNSVFETNSSSTHSLVYSKKDRKTKNPLELDANHRCYDDVEKGLLCVRFGEFGWGPAILVDPRDKLNYLMTQIADEVIGSYDAEEIPWPEIQKRLLADSKVQKVLQVIQKHLPEVKGFKFLRPGESPYEEDADNFTSYYPVGYIDHESCGTANAVSPEELIFNDKILILIDNDNSYVFEDYLNNYDENWERKLPPNKDPEELFELTGYDFDYDDRW